MEKSSPLTPKSQPRWGHYPILPSLITRGNAASTNTLTASSGSTSQKVPTSLFCPMPMSKGSRTNSTLAPERYSATKPLARFSSAPEICPLHFTVEWAKENFGKCLGECLSPGTFGAKRPAERSSGRFHRSPARKSMPGRQPLVRCAARGKSRFAGPSQSSFSVCGKDTSLLVAKSAFCDQVAGLLVPFDGPRGEVALRERLLSHRDLIHDPRDRCRRGMAHQLNETRILA